MEEIWKDIKGYEGLYQISNLGRVYSKPRKVSRKGYKDYLTREKVSYGILQKNGYYCCDLLGKRFYVHRIVSIHFIDNPYNKPIINHKDGNKSNNHVKNLERSTYSENGKHAFENGMNLISAKNKRANIETNGKEIVRVDSNKNRRNYESISQAARENNLQISSISCVINKKRNRKTAGGYQWFYKEEV